VTDQHGFQLHEVGLQRDETTILHDISVVIPDTGITVVAGPSGSGKSSLLRLLNRLDDPSTGAIRWRGQDLTATEPSDLRRRVAMVFQNPVVFAGTVLDNLRTASPELSEPMARELLADVCLDPAWLARDAGRLSGGEAQRLCLARALTTEPDVVLADEPTASLDSESRQGLEQLALEMVRPAGWIWVTHDTDQIGRLADHIVVVAEGTVLTSGPAADVAASEDPVVRRSLDGTPP